MPYVAITCPPPQTFKNTPLAMMSNVLGGGAAGRGEKDRVAWTPDWSSSERHLTRVHGECQGKVRGQPATSAKPDACATAPPAAGTRRADAAIRGHRTA